MDAITLTQFLAPFLPFLIQIGNKAAEGAANKFGEDAWVKAKAVWSKLQPKVEAKQAAKEAATDVAMNPENEDLHTALRVQLKKLLEQDEGLAEEIAQIMRAGSSRSGFPTDTGSTSIRMKVDGNNNQTIGQTIRSKVFRDVQGPLSIDESQNKKVADRGGTVADGNVTRTSSILSNNMISFGLIGILALVAVVWMLGVRISPKGIYIETQGSQQQQQTKPSTKPTTSP